MVPEPVQRVELRQALRQPCQGYGLDTGVAVRTDEGLERLRRSAPAGLPQYPRGARQAVRRRRRVAVLRGKERDTRTTPEPRVSSDGEAAVTQDTSMGSIRGWTIPLMVGQRGRDRPWTKCCVWSGSTV